MLNNCIFVCIGNPTSSFGWNSNNNNNTKFVQQDSYEKHLRPKAKRCSLCQWDNTSIDQADIKMK